MADGNAFSSLLLPLVLLVGLYLLLIRPQRSRAKALAQVRASVQSGSRVITTAGLYATVVATDEDDGTLVLEIAPGVHARFASAAVVKVLDEAAGPTDGPPNDTSTGDARPDDGT